MKNSLPRPADALDRMDTAGLFRDDSDKMSRGISNISNDSIRHLIKIASIGIEEQFSLDNHDLTEICDSWDVPLGPDFGQYDQQPMDLQMEVDAMKRQIQQSHDMEPEYLEMPGYDGMGLSAGQEAAAYDAMMQTYDHPPPPQEIRERPYEVPPAYDERPMPLNMEKKMTPELDVQGPRVKLVLDSNVVMLDRRFCPRPAVTVLPSQVIHAPGHPSPGVMSQDSNVSCARKSRRSVLGNANTHSLQGHGSTPLPNNDYDWSFPRHVTQSYPAISMYDTRPPFSYDQTDQSSMVNEVNGEFSRMMMDGMQAPFMTAAMNAPCTLDPRQMGAQCQPSMDIMSEDRAGKVVRKNTNGDKLPVEPISYRPEDLLESENNEDDVSQMLNAARIESRSGELRRIESMTEADICNYVKSMAPQLQNNAWEEVVRETNFEDRLRKAEQKMKEHNDELVRIRSEVENGIIDHKSAQEMERKVYNRREAAASRTKREQGLVKAAIKVTPSLPCPFFHVFVCAEEDIGEDL